MQNNDPAELDNFNRLAEQWWDPQGPFAALHDINPLRIDYIQRFAELGDREVLDVGCGGGILSEALAKAGAKVQALDLADDVIAIAEQHARSQALDIGFHLESAEQHAARHPQRYDVVCCLEMLEHVPDPESVIAACAALLKPGGSAIFSTLNRNPKSFGLGIVAAEYLLGMVPRGTHDYARFIKPSELARGLRVHGLQPIDLCGIRYQPLHRRFVLDPDDVDVNYLLAAKK